MNERAVFYPPENILAEVSESLSCHKTGEIERITFVGSGETTLYADLGSLIQEVKRLTHIPVAVITNGALLTILAGGAPCPVRG